MISLDEVEREIEGHYRFFFENAPGVVVQERGHLADLWAIADAYYALEEQ